MAVYLVDYENVNHGGLAGIETLRENDRVVLFLGKNTPDFPKETIHVLINSKPEVTLRKMRKAGKNYLDFQLAATLGLLIGSTDESDYFIISGDRDFDKVKDFAEPSRNGVTIKRQPSIVVGEKAAVLKAGPEPPALSDAYKKQIRAAIKPEGLNGGSYKAVYSVFASSKTSPKLQSALAKKFQPAQGNRLYHMIRKIYEDYAADMNGRG